MPVKLDLKYIASWVSRVWLGIAVIVTVAGCAGGTKRLELEGVFPVPLMEKAPVNLGIHLDEALIAYTHKESIERQGEWEVAIGPAQKQLFNNLAQGAFEGYAFVDGLIVDAPLDGVLKPKISEVQFSLPSQTRSDYYEVWIRYEFELYDRAGGKIGVWKLPAYGKANQNNFGSASNGLQAAAMAACRDAMAFFSINFTREPVVQQWLANGKPSAAPTSSTPATAQPGVGDPGDPNSDATPGPEDQDEAA